MTARKSLGWIMGLGALALMVAADAHAWGNKKHQCPHDQRDRLFEELDLDSDRKAKLDALHEARRDTMKEMKNQRESLTAELREMMDRGATDAEITAKVDALVNNWKALRSSMDEHIEEMREFLTPVQQAKLALRFAEKGAHHGHGKGKGCFEE